MATSRQGGGGVLSSPCESQSGFALSAAKAKTHVFAKAFRQGPQMQTSGTVLLHKSLHRNWRGNMKLGMPQVMMPLLPHSHSFLRFFFPKSFAFRKAKRGQTGPKGKRLRACPVRAGVQGRSPLDLRPAAGGGIDRIG